MALSLPPHRSFTLWEMHRSISLLVLTFPGRLVASVGVFDNKYGASGVVAVVADDAGGLTFSSLSDCSAEFLIDPSKTLQIGTSSFSLVKEGLDAGSRIFVSNEYAVTIGYVQGTTGLTLGVQTSVRFSSPFKSVIDVSFSPKKQPIVLSSKKISQENGQLEMFQFISVNGNGTLWSNSSIDSYIGPDSGDSDPMRLVVNAISNVGSFGGALAAFDVEGENACVVGLFPNDNPETVCINSPKMQGKSSFAPNSFTFNKTLFVNHCFVQQIDILDPQSGVVWLVQYAFFNQHGIGAPALKVVHFWEFPKQ